MTKNEGIMVFKDTFEYLTEGLLNEHQFCELSRMIYNARFNGVVYNDDDIDDTQLKLIWKTLKHSINKSSQNARAYENKLKKAENKPIESVKEEKCTEIPLMPQKPKIEPLPDHMWDNAVLDYREPTKTVVKTQKQHKGSFIEEKEENIKIASIIKDKLNMGSVHPMFHKKTFDDSISKMCVEMGFDSGRTDSIKAIIYN